ncbi:uncharacterized protein LOC122498317 [Leptopilina heterotoma]|uniref:uncharacterized protein LOC122498317 n=1 Tax=Leptopilina heterotoma TaxID=63436 RepID=UPI001CA90C41|nr:uncharacterized protein LOC122498317 [Leptopilina heterotoma]
MASVQLLGALRIASCYRTVSEPATLIIARVIPIDLMAQERKMVYDRDEETSKTDVRKKGREMSMRIWQDRWNGETRGRWTFRLIPRIDEWLNQQCGEINYYLTQLLTGHDYFLTFFT